MINLKMAHNYHVVTNSPWPLTATISAFSLFLGFVLLLSGKIGGTLLSLLALISLLISMTFWFLDINIESSYQGEHTVVVQKGISLGFLLFVISEACVFFGLFFAFFYNSLVPSIEIGSFWPPVGIVTLDYTSVPLFNTIILLTSGFSITAAHNFILNRDFLPSFFYLFLTLFLGLLFSFFQYFEYANSLFTLTDSVYGSSFFILTGCHAFHIIVGSFLLLFSLIRLAFNHFSNFRHLLFSFSALYWHFVDAIWLFLFLVLYIW